MVFVWEKRPTPEQVERARKLQLPDAFFLYEDSTPCPGCIGCDPDNFDPNKQTVIAAQPKVKDTKETKATVVAEAGRRW